jgi:hypothetical protein
MKNPDKTSVRVPGNVLVLSRAKVSTIGLIPAEWIECQERAAGNESILASFDIIGHLAKASAKVAKNRRQPLALGSQALIY